MTASPISDDRLPAVVDSLTSGFQSLLTSLRAHRALEKTLRQRLEFAANEVCNFDFLSTSALSLWL